MAARNSGVVSFVFLSAVTGEEIGREYINISTYFGRWRDLEARPLSAHDVARLAWEFGIADFARLLRQDDFGLLPGDHGDWRRKVVFFLPGSADPLDRNADLSGSIVSDENGLARLTLAVLKLKR